MNKGQIESVGLVLVVVVIVILLVFTLPFLLKEDTRNSDSLLSAKADALRVSVLSYTLCNEVSMKEEILNCESNAPECLEDCGKLEDEIKNMIDSVLEPNIVYEFKVEGSKPIIIGDTSSCLNKFNSASQPLSRNLKVEVSLCMK